MALSRLDLARLVSEIGPALAGGVVSRIWRDGDDLFVILVRTAERRVGLEVSLDPDAARVVALPEEDVELSDPKDRKAKKLDPHPFLGRLRKALAGGRVESVTQAPGERIVFIDVAGRDEDEPGSRGEEAPPGSPAEARGEDDAPVERSSARMRLAVELTGRATNLVLIDRSEGAATIVTALRPGRPTRPLAGGTAYALPPPRGSGRSRGEEAPPGAADAGEAPAEDVLAPGVEPDPATLALSRAVAELQRARSTADAAADRREALLRAVVQAEKKAHGLRAKLEREREEVRNAEELRQKGELLKANAGRIPRGAARAVVTDFFAPEPRDVELELDPLVPVLDQARALFKRAKKWERGAVAIETRLGEADARIEELGAVRARIEAAAADDDAALSAALRSLSKLGCAPPAPKPAHAPPPKKTDGPPTGPRRFVSKDRLQVLVGRSNTENDHLTMTIAHGNDLFFHVRGTPGSHVIVRIDRGKSVPLETLLDAAALAVHYSKSRGNTRAEVTYTPRKFVSKPRGAKPGLVHVANERTIRPDGDPRRLARVLATAGRTPADVEGRGGEQPPPRSLPEAGRTADGGARADDDAWEDA